MSQSTGQNSISSDILREVVFLQNMRRSGVMLSFVTSPDKIEDDAVKAQILSADKLEQELRQRNPNAVVPKRKHWIDVGSCKLCVYLPNIESAKELHSIVFRELVTNYGLSGLLGPERYKQLCIHLYNTMPPKQQERYKRILCISKIDNESKSIIGNAFCEWTAKQMNNADDVQFAKNRWNVIRHRILESLNISEDKLPLTWFELSQCLCSSILDYRKRNEYLLKASDAGDLDRAFRESLLSTHEREKEGSTLDRGGRFIFMGYPSDILVSTSARMHSDPIELPLGAIYGYPKNDELGRYATAMDQLKKDKHPFDLTNIINLPRDLRKPLAVFASRHGSRPDTSIVLCQTRGPVISTNEKDVITPKGDMGNFVVPITPRNVFYDRENGRRFSQTGGKRINNIDSVYTKKDFEILRWLSRKRLVLYLDPNFHRNWLVPTIVKYNAFFEGKKAELEAQQKEYNEHKAAMEKIKPAAILQFDSAEDGDRWSLLKLYREYTSLVESATKVVKEFENPKIISQKKVLYSISKEKDLPKGEKEVVGALVKHFKAAGINTFMVPDTDPVLEYGGNDGRRALGYTDGRSIFLSETAAGAGTAMHELSHVLLSALQLSDGQKAEELVEALTELPEYRQLENDVAYAALAGDRSALASEAFSKLIEEISDKAMEDALNSPLERGSLEESFWAHLEKGLADLDGKPVIKNVAAELLTDFKNMKLRQASKHGEVVRILPAPQTDARAQDDSSRALNSVIIRTNKAEVLLTGEFDDVEVGDRVYFEGFVNLNKRNSEYGKHNVYATSTIAFIPHDYPSEEIISNARAEFGKKNGFVNERGTVLSVENSKRGDRWSATIERFNGSVVTLSGSGTPPQPDTHIEARVSWSDDKKNYCGENYFEIKDGYKSAVEKYLMELPRIGEKTAKNIVERYGIASLDILEYCPELLTSKRIKPKKSDSQSETHQRISEKDAEFVERRSALIWLMSLGTSFNAAQEIDKEFGPDTIKSISENPYLLMRMDGYDFKKTDSLARRFGIESSNPLRVASYIHYMLRRNERNGDTCISRYVLKMNVLRQCFNNDMSKGPAVDKIIYSMLNGSNPSLVLYGKDTLLHPDMAKNEESVVDNLQRLIETNAHAAKSERLSDEKIEELFSQEQEKTGFALSDPQKEAVKLIINEPVSVVSGAPGAGKTTMVKAALAALEKAGYQRNEIALCAPTGKAAKRLSQQTERTALTIHRLLGYNPETGYEKNRYSKLKASVIIVDESSMVDCDLMSRLLEAVKTGSKVVFIGDFNQLPSVGPGQVLLDMLSSGRIPYAQLNQIFRQGKDSDIITAAMDVKDGRASFIDNLPEENTPVEKRVNNGRDFSFIPVSDPLEDNIPGKINETVLQICRDILPEAGYSQNDIQVITPIKGPNDPASTKNLNPVLQFLYNPLGEEYKITPDSVFHKGDKVMVTKNSAELGVFNGDQGTVVGFNKEEKILKVDFSESGSGAGIVEFDASTVSNLTLAYAITVHKSQGSEYPCVVIALHDKMAWMLNWKLLYTAITRGKKKVILVGTPSAVNYAVRNNMNIERHTMLTRRLQGLLPEKCVPLHTNTRNTKSLIEGNLSEAGAKREPGDDALMNKKQPPLEAALSALSPREREVLVFLHNSVRKAGIDLHFVPDAVRYIAMDAVADDKKLYYNALGRTQDLKDAASKGVVNMKALNANIFFTKIDEYALPLPGDDRDRRMLFDKLRQDMTPTWEAHAGSPEQFYFKINPNVITSLLQPSRKNAVVSNDAKVAILRSLPGIVASAVDLEISSGNHAQGTTGPIAHKLLAGVEFNGDYFKVMLTCSESRDQFMVEQINIERLNKKLVVSSSESMDSEANDAAYASVAKMVEGEYMMGSGQLILDYDNTDNYKTIKNYFVNELSPIRCHLTGRSYGWVDGNDMFITRDGLNPYTTIKNYAHMWAEAVRIGNPELWKNISDTVKRSGEWDTVRRLPQFKGAHYNENYLIAEVIARSSKDMLCRVMDNVRLTGSKESASMLLKTASSFWDWTGKNLFEISSFESFNNITSRVLYDLVSGSDLQLRKGLDENEAKNKARDLVTYTIGIPEGDYKLEKTLHAGLVTEIPGETMPSKGEYVLSVNSLSIRDFDITLHCVVEDEEGEKKEAHYTAEEFFSIFKEAEHYNSIKFRIQDIKENIARNASPVQKKRDELRKKAHANDHMITSNPSTKKKESNEASAQTVTNIQKK